MAPGSWQAKVKETGRQRISRPRILRLTTPRLLLRVWHPDDAPRLLEAIQTSLPELQRWMDWAAREPESLATKRRRLAGFRRRTLAGGDALLGIFDRDEREVLGAIGLHADIGQGGRALGYWLRSDRTGQGLAGEAAAAVARAAFARLHLRRIEIHCHPANARSAAVAQRLGCTHAVTIANCVTALNRGPRDIAVWVMTQPPP